MANSNRTAVITGASSGIGLALAAAYLSKGFNVVGNARTAQRLHDAARRIDHSDRFLAVAGDIADPNTSERLFSQAISRFGSVDVLVNNAGIFSVKPVIDYSPSEVDSLVNTNLKGLVYATQQAARHMMANKRGHIVNISASIASQPIAGVPASVPILIKGGINALTKALAIELAPHNIKVAAVAPGIIDTPLYTADMHDFLRTLQPVGRIGTVTDIAQAVLYLTESEFTTGIVLPVDGGMSAGKW